MHAHLTLRRRPDPLSNATAGSGSTLDITALLTNLIKEKEQNLPPFSKKHLAESKGYSHRGKALAHVNVIDADYNCNTLYAVIPKRTRKVDPARLYNPNVVYLSPQQSSVEISPQQLQSPAPKAQASYRQPGLIELQRYETRYPDLILRSDSRSISQEQLATELKTMMRLYEGTVIASPRQSPPSRRDAVWKLR
jgi:hypothetical protein